jgi:hypothetical protein
MGAKMRKAGWFCRAFIVKSEAIRTHKRPKANGSDMKQKKCKAKGCGVVFSPARPMQCVCSPACAQLLARAKTEQAETKQRQEQRKADRAKREKLKTRSDWIKEAQREFNRFIRLRDSGKPCVCCGSHLGDGDVGGAFDCGHYRSVGSAPHLRFDERNAHAQRKQCNRYGSGRAVDYRIGLVARYGLAFVEGLERDQSPKHYTIEDLKHIRDTYRAKCKELEKEQG